jgi:hypothetical protein
MPGPIPTHKRIRRLAEKTKRRNVYDSRFTKAASRRYEALNLPGDLQEDQAGALWKAYRKDKPKKRRKAVKRAWLGGGY